MHRVIHLSQEEKDQLRRDIFRSVQNELLNAIKRNALFSETVRNGDNTAQHSITEEVMLAVVYLFENVFELKDAPIPGQNVAQTSVTLVPQRDTLENSATASPARQKVVEKTVFADSRANVKPQVGGQHYREAAVQHWDFAAVQGMDYFQGQITKYVTRWKKKNGRQDLEKALHFLEKYIEVHEHFAADVHPKS